MGRQVACCWAPKGPGGQGAPAQHRLTALHAGSSWQSRGFVAAPFKTKTLLPWHDAQMGHKGHASGTSLTATAHAVFAGPSQA